MLSSVDTAKPPPTPEVLVRTSAASAADCPYGGTVVSAGLDANGNGALEEGEVRTRTTVCNDAPVKPPPPIVVRLVAEPIGEHCSDGGTAVQSGPDQNGNGKLDDAEVSHTDYVCGEQLLSRIAIEPPGANCTAGGLSFLVGRDRDHDGVLDDGEVEKTEYECSDILSRDVTIASKDDVVALAGIAVINGGLTVGGSVDVVTLPRLEHLGGSLSIERAGNLTRLAAPELSNIAGDVTVRSNPGLTALDLPQLQTIVGRIRVEDNAALADLRGLPALTRVGGNFEISENAALAALTPSIRHIGGRLFVRGNPNLAAIDVTIANGLAEAVLFNNGTTSIRLAVVFETTDPVLGRVHVVEDHLTSISLEADIIGSILYSGTTDVLTDLTVHATQIQRDMEIRSASLRHLTFATPSSFQRFQIQGSLRLVSPLETLRSDASDLVIDGICSLANTRLTSLSALSSVGTLDLGGNTGLTTLSGFEALAFHINGNQTLESITLQQSEVLGFSEILSNPMLRNVSLGGLRRTAHASLVIARNPSLTRIVGPSLVGIDGQLAIDGNAALTDVSFDQLRDIAELLVLINNPALTSFSLPSLVSSGGMFISTNAALHHLAFDALALPTAMTVAHNHALPACEVDALFDRIPGPQFQDDNDEDASCMSP